MFLCKKLSVIIEKLIKIITKQPVQLNMILSKIAVVASKVVYIEGFNNYYYYYKNALKFVKIVKKLKKKFL